MRGKLFKTITEMFILKRVQVTGMKCYTRRNMMTHGCFKTNVPNQLTI